MLEDESPPSPISFKSLEDSLLYHSRFGDSVIVRDLLQLKAEGKIKIDINCKGEQKGNHGWTPLHLAAYFNHRTIVKLLIDYGANINVINEAGDTPLHKAAYSGREEVVLLLLSKNADVFIRNSENAMPRDITKNHFIKALLKATEVADTRIKNSILLNAAREGDIQVMEDILKSDHPPHINCVDSRGNSALHCAAYRGQKEAAVLLLQNGIDTAIKNLRGQSAADMALNLSMKQVLSVPPVKHFQKTVTRFEGLLHRESRFTGVKEVWTVLDKGVILFFNSRADSTTGTNWKGYKYLDGARVDLDNADFTVFTLTYSDNTRQRFSVPTMIQQKVDRQKWQNAILEHVEFSSRYLKQISSSVPNDEDVMPVGTLHEKLQRHKESGKIENLQKELVGEPDTFAKDKAVLVLCELLLGEHILQEVKTHRLLFLRFTHGNQKAQKFLLGGLEQVINLHKDSLMNKVPHILKLFYDIDILEEEVLIDWSQKMSSKYVDKEIAQQIHEKAKPFIKWLQEAEEEESSGEDDGEEAVELRLLQGKQQNERCTEPQDALYALAQKPHELEKSWVAIVHSPPNSSQYEDTDCEEFFDALEGDSSPEKNVLNSISGSNTFVAGNKGGGCVPEEVERRGSSSAALPDIFFSIMKPCSIKEILDANKEKSRCDPGKGCARHRMQEQLHILGLCIKKRYKITCEKYRHQKKYILDLDVSFHQLCSIIDYVIDQLNNVTDEENLVYYLQLIPKRYHKFQKKLIDMVSKKLD